MKYLKYPIVLLIFLIAENLFAQNGKNVFNDTILHRIDISIQPENWFDILETDYKNNFTNPTVYPEIYRPCDVRFDGKLLLNCGIREKGNSSNTMHNGNKKKPFKIAFDEFKDQKLDGLKKINLNNFTNDPSLVHESIMYKLIRNQGLVASRTSYARVYFNGEYWGLYLLVENVDKTFLKYHYGDANNGGNLYKTDAGAQVFLNWQGYDTTPYIKSGLILKTNEDIRDWNRLLYFLDLLNHTPDNQAEAMLDSQFDVHSYLKLLAIEKCLRSWDSYWGGGNNFYIYEHPDGKIRWIPWDLNETFQDIKILSGTKLLDGYLLPTRTMDERPLTKKIFGVEKWKQEYLNNVCSLITGDLDPKRIGLDITRWHTIADFAYREDPNKFNSYLAFQQSLTQWHADEMVINKSPYQVTVRYPGIIPFINDQRNWASDQLKKWNQNCKIEEQNTKYPLQFFPNPATKNEIFIAQHDADYDYSQIAIYNSRGVLVQLNDYAKFQGGKTRVELMDLSPGFYMVLKRDIQGNLGYAKLIIE